MSSNSTGSSGVQAKGNSALHLLSIGSSNWFPVAVHLGSMLIVTPLLLSHLGNTDFGIWALVNSLVGFYGLLGLGIGSGIMRYVPYYLGRSDTRSASAIVSTGLAVYGFVAIVIVGISQLAAEPIADFYEAGESLAALVRIIGFAAAIECPMRVLDACVRAREGWIPANLAAAVAGIVRAIALAACVYAGLGLVELGYVSVAVAALLLIQIAIVYCRTCPEIKLGLGLVSGRFLKQLVIFGLFTTVVTLAYTLTMSGHRLIVGKLLSLEAVAFYAVASMLVFNVQSAAITPTQAFWPRFASLDAVGSRESVADLLVRGTRYGSLLACGMIGVLVVTGPGFIRLWLGPEYEQVTPVLVVLCAGYLIAASTGIAGNFLAGTGRQGVQALLAALEAVLGLGLSLFLGLELGAFGVALGFTISVALLRGWVRTVYVCRLIQTSARSYVLRSLAPAWLIVIGIAGYAYASGLAERDLGWIGLGVLGVSVAGVYLLLGWLLAIDRNERRGLLDAARRFLVDRNQGPAS